jgi:DNA-binding beta-propeller fold protein YncE
MAGLVCVTVALAQPGSPPAPPHEHKLVEIAGEPILSRVKAELQRPCRVAIDSRGDLLIVDAAANKVVRVADGKKGTTFAAGLSDPSGICFDRAGNCYVSNFARGETNAGSVVRISTRGKTEVVAARLTGPKGLAFGRDGKLYIAVFGEGRIVTIDAKGQLREFCRNVATPAAIVFDVGGLLYAANSVDGTVTRITPAGKSAVVWRGLNMPTDLAVSLEGEILVNSYGSGIVHRLLPSGKTETYLKVPSGTIGLCIDGGGNAVVVNWDHKLAVRIRDRLSVPCPHCGKMIPLRISPKATRKKTKPRTAI